MNAAEVKADMVERGIGEGVEVMHPSSVLFSRGYTDGLYGLSPAFPGSSRYDSGYALGSGVWAGLLAEARGE